MTDEPKSAELELPAHSARGTPDGERAEAPPPSSRGAPTLVGVAPQAGEVASQPNGAPPSAGAPVVVAAGHPAHDDDATLGDEPAASENPTRDDEPTPGDDQEFELPGTIGPDTHRRMQEASDLEAREAFLKTLAAHLSDQARSEQRARLSKWLLVLGCAVGLSFPIMLWLGGREPPERLPRQRPSPASFPNEGASAGGRATQAEEGSSSDPAARTSGPGSGRHPSSPKAP